jgi:hypothetical protein
LLHIATYCHKLLHIASTATSKEQAKNNNTSRSLSANSDSGHHTFCLRPCALGRLSSKQRLCELYDKFCSGSHFNWHAEPSCSPAWMMRGFAFWALSPSWTASCKLCIGGSDRGGFKKQNSGHC